MGTPTPAPAHRLNLLHIHVQRHPLLAEEVQQPHQSAPVVHHPVVAYAHLAGVHQLVPAADHLHAGEAKGSHTHYQMPSLRCRYTRSGGDSV